jgi:hypothetical protein
MTMVADLEEEKVRRKRGGAVQDRLNLGGETLDISFSCQWIAVHFFFWGA